MTKRARAWRPTYDPRAPKVWDPEKAATLPLYPKTPEAYEAMRARNREAMAKTRAAGGFSRLGVPDGWAGRKEELKQVREEAGRDGEAFRVNWMAGHNQPPDLQREREATALGALFSLYRDPTVKPPVRLQAAACILNFTRAKPAAVKHVVRMAEDFMASFETRLCLVPMERIRPA